MGVDIERRKTRERYKEAAYREMGRRHGPEHAALVGLWHARRGLVPGGVPSKVRQKAVRWAHQELTRTYPSEWLPVLAAYRHAAMAEAGIEL